MKLTPSLSIIVPVHNLQSSITQRATQLLDAAEELNCNFEMLLVDNGSTDHSSELIADLAARFPQVRAEYFGFQASDRNLRSAKMLARGGTIVVHEPASPMNANAIRRMLHSAARKSRSESAKRNSHTMTTAADGSLIGHDSATNPIAGVPHAFASKMQRDATRRDVSGMCPPKYRR